MKKHIFGLMLFGFIVSAAAVIYAFFSVSKIAPVYEIVSTPRYVLIEREQPKIDAPIVTQAIYHLKTKKLDWKYNPSNSSGITLLHFWVVDEKGAYNLRSIPAESFPQNQEVIKLDWQDLNISGLPSKANIYLVPDTFRDTSPNFTDYHPRFDIDKAIPVTVDYGK